MLDRPLLEDSVHGLVDADRRRDHMQQHHGQHLLSKAFVEVARAQTIAFHLGSEVTTIDLDRLVGEEPARAAERRANEVAWEARPVRVSTVTTAQARAEGLSSRRALPTACASSTLRASTASPAAAPTRARPPRSASSS